MDWLPVLRAVPPAPLGVTRRSNYNLLSLWPCEVIYKVSWWESSKTLALKPEPTCEQGTKVRVMVSAPWDSAGASNSPVDLWTLAVFWDFIGDFSSIELYSEIGSNSWIGKHSRGSYCCSSVDSWVSFCALSTSSLPSSAAPPSLPCVSKCLLTLTSKGLNKSLFSLISNYISSFPSLVDVPIRSYSRDFGSAST